MLKVKYSLILLHLSTLVITARSHDEKNSCVVLIDTYISLLLKKYPGLILPSVTYEQLLTLSKGSFFSIPQIPEGGVGILQGSKTVTMRKMLLEELRHFQSAFKYLTKINDNPMRPTTPPPEEYRDEPVQQEVELISPEVDEVTAGTQESQNTPSKRKWLNTSYTVEVNEYGGFLRPQAVPQDTGTDEAPEGYNKENDNSSSGHVTVKPAAEKYVILPPKGVLKLKEQTGQQGVGIKVYENYEKRKEKFEHNTLGGNQESAYRPPSVSPSMVLSPYQPEGNQNIGIKGILRPLQPGVNQGDPMFSREDKTGGMKQGEGTKVYEKYEKRKEKFEHNTFGGNQESAYRPPSMVLSPYQPGGNHNFGIKGVVRPLQPGVNQGDPTFSRDDNTGGMKQGEGTKVYEKYEKRKEKFHHNTFEENQESAYGPPSMGLSPYQPEGNQNSDINGIFRPSQPGVNQENPMYSREDHAGGMKHLQQAGIRFKETVERHKEEREHHQVGGAMLSNQHHEKQIKESSFPATDALRDGDLGFYLAGGEVKTPVNPQNNGEISRYRSMIDRGRRTHSDGLGPIEKKEPTNIVAHQDGLEIIEPGGVREVVKGGQKVLISNTNCPDNSELCIKIH